MTDTYALVDGVADDDFDAAIAEARADENLSRANVIRKVKGITTDRLTPGEKLVRIRRMASTSATSQDIARAIGGTAEYVRQVARDNGIAIVADVVMGRTRSQSSVAHSCSPPQAFSRQVIMTRLRPPPVPIPMPMLIERRAPA